MGIATDRDSTAAILTAEPAGLVSVAQVRQTVLDPPLPVPAGVGVLTHSAVAPLIGPLSDALRDESLRRRWCEELGLEPAGSELGRLLLAAVVELHPDRVVLFSSTDESRLRGNAALGDAPAFSDDQLARFRRLAAELLSPGGPR